MEHLLLRRDRTIIALQQFLVEWGMSSHVDLLVEHILSHLHDLVHHPLGPGSTEMQDRLPLPGIGQPVDGQ